MHNNNEWHQSHPVASCRWPAVCNVLLCLVCRCLGSFTKHRLNVLVASPVPNDGSTSKDWRLLKVRVRLYNVNTNPGGATITNNMFNVFVSLGWPIGVMMCKMEEQNKRNDNGNLHFQEAGQSATDVSKYIVSRHFLLAFTT